MCGPRGPCIQYGVCSPPDVEVLTDILDFSSILADRVFVRDFFVFLQDKSSSNIFAEEFRRSNISETQGCCHHLFAAVGYSPPACARYPGKPFYDLKRQFENAVRKAKLKDVTFHTLRHSCASHLFMNGVDLATVREILSGTRITRQRFATVIYHMITSGLR